MRRVLASDGIVEDPGWTSRFTGEEQEKSKPDELAATDAHPLNVFPEGS